jgi:hypothetical protein
MSTMLIVVAPLFLLAGGALAFFGGAKVVERRAKQNMELVPGTPSRVPDNWFGSHDPEPKLYRRLLESVRGVQAMGSDQSGSSETIASMQRQARQIEGQLIGVTHIAARLRPPILEQLEQTVIQIEQIAAAIIGREAGWERFEIGQALDALTERLQLIDKARAELDQTEPGT